MSEALSCDAAGIPYITWRKWKKQDTLLAELARRAKGLRAKQRVRNIERSGNKGDWRASAYLLEHDPHTRDQYKKAEQGGGSIAVQVNVFRGDFNDIKSEDVYNAEALEGEFERE